MIWSTMITLSQSFPPLMPKISGTGLPQLQVCLTACCVGKKKNKFLFRFEFCHALLLLTIPLLFCQWGAAILPSLHHSLLSRLSLLLWWLRVSWEGWDLSQLSDHDGGEWLVYACWSALVPHRYARFLSCFFTIGNETLWRVQISSRVSSITPFVWNTSSLQISDLSPLPPTPGLNCEAKINFVGLQV